MKTQIKQLFYGILATSCFGLSCTSLTLGPKEYQWPPKDGEPIVTLLGPVYETGSETQAPLFKALEQAMTAIVENQQTHLPEFYQQRITGMNHQLFRPGYSNEEEWGSIKSLSSKAEDYDSERIAGILESSENRKHGLEMAIRMQPTIDPHPASVTLEGYRFVLQPSGKGQAEWLTQEVKFKKQRFKQEKIFQKALIWLLAKPFFQVQKTFVLDSKEVPVWKDKNTAGILTFAKKEFTADAEPIRKETVEACVQTRFCPLMKVEGDEFALVSNFTDAQAICRMFDNEVIDENTLLRLSLNMVLEKRFIHSKSKGIVLDEGNSSAWHSGGETGYFNKISGHQEFVQAKKGLVWCKLAKQETSPTFEIGTYMWSDGRKYEGDFKDGKPNGFGFMIFPNGRSKYEGEWKNGLQNGKGTWLQICKSKQKWIRCTEKFVGQYKEGLRWSGILYNGWGKIKGKWAYGIRLECRGMGSLQDDRNCTLNLWYKNLNEKQKLQRAGWSCEDWNEESLKGSGKVTRVHAFNCAK